MFDFEKLEVYQVIKNLNVELYSMLHRSSGIDEDIKSQWKRASLSVMLNLTEGVGRMSNPDKRHFLTIARGSVFESVAILDFVHSLKLIDQKNFDTLYAGYEKTSKMLLGMYRSYK